MDKIEIIPSILATTYEEFKHLMDKLAPCTGRVHIDIIDGQFVSSKTVDGYNEFSKIGEDIKADVHLMVKEPMACLSSWYKTKADRIIIHIEVDNVGDTISDIRNNNRQAGLSINPDTEIEAVESFIDKIDFIQFMTVYPGFYGAKFVDKVLDKIELFHERYPDVPIMADGGVNPVTILKLYNSGVTMFVVGSYISKSVDPASMIDELKKSILKS
jgi:ribulose-phosphate 3-epimerase